MRTPVVGGYGESGIPTELRRNENAESPVSTVDHRIYSRTLVAMGVASRGESHQRRSQLIGSLTQLERDVRVEEGGISDFPKQIVSVVVDGHFQVRIGDDVVIPTILLNVIGESLVLVKSVIGGHGSNLIVV